MTIQNSFDDNLYSLQSSLHNVAILLTRDSKSADDLVIDTTLEAINSKHTFEAGANFKKWILTIMRNLFISNSKNNADTSDKVYRITFCRQTGLSVPEGAMSVKEICASLTQMTKEIRETFVMHIRGFEPEEISDTLNIPLHTVRSRIVIAHDFTCGLHTV